VSRKSKREGRAEKRRKKARKERTQARNVKKRTSRRTRDNDSDGAVIPDGYSTPLMKNFGFKNPFFGLTDDQRCELAKSIGGAAAKRFQDGIGELGLAVREHDPVELLATSAFYCLFKGVGSNTDFTAESPYLQATVELLQSICLRYRKDQFGATPMLHPYLFRLLDLGKECSKDFGLQRFSAFADAEPSKRSLLMSIEEARLHTQLMRNWGYPQHMRQIIRELLDPLEDEIASRIGVGPIAFLDLTDALSRESCKRAFTFMDAIGEAFRETNLRKMVNAFCRIVRLSDDDAESIFQLMKSRPGPNQAKRLFLVSYFHQFLPDLFVFTLDDCVRLASDANRSCVETVLDDLSFAFGDLESENPEHLVMQSRIRTRPIIKIDSETYFLPVHGLINSFFLEIVESWIKPHADLKQLYHKRRAAYLEDSLKKMLKEAFPGCPIHTGTTWVDPEDSKEYENDCLIVCGPLALVFEAKSERVDDVAKRGGVKTLEDHYDTLVCEPARQAARLARLLEVGSGIRRFKTKKHGEFDLELSGIRRAVCISVTLDWLPAASLCWQKLVASGLVPPENRPAINLSLADLLIVLQVLESPAKRIHYFWRRIEWEARVEYLADEEDLLVYYLSEGLAIPQPEDGSDRRRIMLYGNSDQLHRYYMAEWADPENLPPLPKRILTPWWSAIIKRIESIDLSHGWDITCVLLDLSFERQQEFEQRFEEVITVVHCDGNDCGMNGLIAYADHTESLGAVVGFAYRGLTTEERNDRAADLGGKAQVEAGAERVVVIGRNVERRGDPYDLLAYIGGKDTPST
jgi:hypothetical protein